MTMARAYIVGANAISEKLQETSNSLQKALEVLLDERAEQIKSLNRFSVLEESLNSIERLKERIIKIIEQPD